MPSPDVSPGTPTDPGLRTGSLWSLAAALVWPLQALVIAQLLAALLVDGPVHPLLSGAAYLGLAAMRAAFEAAAHRALSAASDRIIAACRDSIIDGEAATTGASSLGGPGAIAALASEKLEALRPYLVRFRPARLRATVLPLLILSIALWYSWAVAAVLLMAGPLIPLFMALVGWAARDASDRQMVEVGQLSDLLVDRLAALADLRLIGAGPALVTGFEDQSERLRLRTMAVLRIAFLSSTVLELFSALGVAMVAVWVGFALLELIAWGSWGTPLSPFVGIYLLLLAPEFFQPLRDMAASWHDKAAGEAVLAELETWRAEPRPTRMGNGGAAEALTGAPDIHLRGVTIDRGTRRLALPDLDIPAGARIALTGPSGIGKTTVLRVLAGLERPAEGSVCVAGVPLANDTADAWRARIGWMPQAPHFLNGSLRHNITFGAVPDATAVQRARIEAVIAALPRADLTVLGERGAGLSSGEARRVTLARALQARPDVLLADEPTADLDPDTAAQVLDGLLAGAGPDQTLIIATHDPRVIARMDRVVDLSAPHHGTQAEAGA